MVKMLRENTRYSYNNCSKMTSTFAQQYRLIKKKTSKYYKKCIKKTKSFIVKDKRDGTNKNDSENSSRAEMSSTEGSSSS